MTMKINSYIPFDFYPEQKKYWNHTDYVYARILSTLESFNFLLQSIRTNGLKLKKLLLIPKDFEISELIYNHLDNKKVLILDDQTDKIIHKYKLTNNWRDSIKLAILTNILFVPFPDNPVTIEYPKAQMIKLAIKKGIRSYKNIPLLQNKLIEKTRYLSIIISSEISFTELRGWLNENSVEISKALSNSNLFKKRVKKIKDRTLYWGRIVWFFREKENMSWSNIDETIVRLFDDESLYPDTEDLIYEIPEYIELKDCYKSYVASLKELEPSDK